MINFIISLNKLLIVKPFMQYVCGVILRLWCYFNVSVYFNVSEKEWGDNKVASLKPMGLSVRTGPV